VTTRGDGLLEVDGVAAERVAAAMAAAGLPVHELTPHRASLEDAYLQLTREAVEYR
jgi:ABC-2 type transport system ATP-binding protein